MKPPSLEQRLLLEQATAQYQADLAADAQAQQYLLRRGFQQETAQRFRLGVVRHPVTGHEGYAGRLAIPYLTPHGAVNINFRCTRDHDCKTVDGHRKYLKPDGSSSNLFNVLDLRQPSDFICIAEGELDAITLSMIGLPAVGVPGVENWQAHFGRCLEDFVTKYVFADGDKAGRKFASFMAKEAGARPVRIPDGHDCNSLYLKEGADGLRELIAG